MQRELDVIAASVDAINAKPIMVTVDCKPRNFYTKYLMKWGILPKQRTFEVRPSTVRNMQRIAKMAVQIPDDYLENKSVSKALIEGISDHMDKMIYIVACGLQNDHREPTPALLDLIKDEFTQAEITGVFDIILSQIGVQDFMRSIVLMRGMKILPVPAKTEQPVVQP